MRRETTSLINKMQWLTLTIATFTLTAAGGGLFFKNLYRDPYSIKLAWFGNDLVTLIVALPMLLTAWVYLVRGSYRAQLVWLGAIAYLIYNYAFYLFGAAFNVLFLVYVSIFTLSLYALIMGFSFINTQNIKLSINKNLPHKWIAAFLFLLALPLGTVEISQCINYILTGDLPAVPPLIYALDLSIIIPNTILAAVLLWTKNAWGYILAGIMLIKAFTYGLVLIVASTMIATTGESGSWDPLMPFYIFVMAGGFAFGIILLINVKNLSAKI